MTLPNRGRNHLDHHRWCGCPKCEPHKNPIEPPLVALEFKRLGHTIRAEAIEYEAVSGQWFVHWRADEGEQKLDPLLFLKFGKTHVNFWNLYAEEAKNGDNGS